MEAPPEASDLAVGASSHDHVRRHCFGARVLATQYFAAPTFVGRIMIQSIGTIEPFRRPLGVTHRRNDCVRHIPLRGRRKGSGAFVGRSLMQDQATMKFRKRQSRLCVECGRRPALFRYRGKVKRDTRHTLCFQCFYVLNDCWRARRLVIRDR